MLKQALGTAVAAVFATAIASAQAPVQGQAEQREYPAGQQTVTVEGCLQEDRVETAQVAEAARDDEKTFLLVNARIQDGEMAQRTGQEVGTTGQAGAQPETPVGTTGADAAATGDSKFKVTGLDESRLEQYAGQRVRIEGRIESGEQQGMTGAERGDDQRTDPAADTLGTVGTTGTPESPATGAGAHDHARAAADRDVKKLHAVSIQPVAGSCPEAPASR